VTDRSTASEDLSRARYELELYLLGGAFDLYEDDGCIATVEPKHATAEVSFGKLIFSCWGEGWSRAWRVLSCQSLPERLRLGCAKQMGRTLCTLELRRGATTGDEAQSRAEFAAKLTAIIQSHFPALRVERIITARDDTRHFSGVHTRLVLNDHGKLVAGIGVSAQESQANIDATLGAGIIWFNELRRRNSLITRLMIFAPSDCALTIATRLTAVRVAGASLALYEVDEAKSSLQPIAPFDQGDLSDHLRRAAMRAQWPRAKALPAEVALLIDSITQRAPELIESYARGGWIHLAIRGLAFARVSTSRKRIEFGIGPAKQILTETNQAQLENLVAEIIENRRADAENRNSAIFRDQSERWLEAIIRRDVTVIDASLDARYVYSQVPAYRGEQRSFIDLLAATREGRLVVIELKVAEDSEFPFQGLDYWLRVDWHRLRGDFHRRGYFKEMQLADTPPLIFLVAPLFRFHATTKLIASCIAERAPLFRIGINEDWRAGVRVLLTERLNETADEHR
jgi:hypothetical protein